MQFRRILQGMGGGGIDATPSLTFRCIKSHGNKVTLSRKPFRALKDDIIIVGTLESRGNNGN